MKLWKKVTLGVVGGFFALGIIGNLLDDNPTVEAASSTTTSTSEVTTTTQPPRTTTQKPTTTANPSDWASEGAYVVDVMDTADKMGGLLSTVAEVSIQVGDGLMDIDTYADLMDSAVTAADSHRGHFAGTTPPAAFEVSHAHLNKALALFSESFTLARDGARSGNVGMIERAVELLAEGADEIESSTAALP